MEGSEPNDVEEWVGMPEFIQEKQEPYNKIIEKGGCILKMRQIIMA